MTILATTRDHTPVLESDAPLLTDLVAFIRDAETRSTLVAALGSQSSGLTINLGGIESAIAQLTRTPTQCNLIVDISGSDEPLIALDRLAEVCMPNTYVLALGDINDVGFYHQLRAVGVADYLVKPFTCQALRGVLVAARRQRSVPEPAKTLAPSAQIIAVTGARGGIGATMVASTLAWLLADTDRQRTMLVDLDLHYGSTALAFDTQPSRGLRDVLTNPDRIDSLFVSSASEEVKENFFLLSTEEPLDNPLVVQPHAVEVLMNELRRDFQRIILDIPCRNIDLLRQGIGQANTVIVVTDFSLAGLRDAGRILAFAKHLVPAAKRLVVGNRAGGAKRGELSLEQIEKTLATKLAAIVPEDDAAILHAMNSGEPLPKIAPASKAMVALRTLAATFDETAVETRPGLLARILGGTKAKVE